MKRIILITAFIFSANILFAQYYMIVNKADGTETVTAVGNIEDITFSDIECGVATVSYSGITYNTVQIGNQCWLKEYLNVGTRIDGSGDQTNNSAIEKYCYNDLDANCTAYGGLYQWGEVMQYITTAGAQGICPDGWHIPTLAEFTILSAEVGDNGNTLKAIGQGTGDGAGTNTSGFSALLAGNRTNSGSFFSNFPLFAFIWSSTENSSSHANYMLLYFDRSTIDLIFTTKTLGYSVRCLKD